MGKILVIYAYYKNINFVLTKCTQNKLNKRFVVVVYFGKYGKGLYSVFYKVRWMLIQYSLSNYKQFSVGKYYYVRVLSAFYLYSEWTARFSKSSMMYGEYVMGTLIPIYVWKKEIERGLMLQQFAPYVRVYMGIF